MPHKLVGMLLGTIFTLLSLGVTHAASPAGTVVGLRGSCFVEGEGRRTPLKIGDALQVADTVEVPASGKLKLRMQDGSVIAVASGTRMTVAAYVVAANGQHREAKLSLAMGLLRAVVAPVEQPARFEVETAVGTAAVRSTDWFVEATPGAMQIGVLTGSVSLTSAATRRAVTIPARWGARLEAGRDPVPARVWTAAEFAAVTTRTAVDEDSGR